MSITMAVSSSSSSFSIHNYQFCHPTYHSALLPRWQSRIDQDRMLFTRKTKDRAYRVLPYLNVYSAKQEQNREVIMVDPLEAKRLAAKEMEQIRAKERFKRWRQIEAINGGWAMIGLTAGLLIEAQNGKTIIEQLVGYIQSIIDFFPW